MLAKGVPYDNVVYEYFLLRACRWTRLLCMRHRTGAGTWLLWPSAGIASEKVPLLCCCEGSGGAQEELLAVLHNNGAA